jgi:hypothetical protein
VEAARAFAERMIREGGAEPAERIEFAFATALGRPPSDAETQALQQLATEHLNEFRADPKAAEEFNSVGQAPVPEDIDPVELAAWGSVGRAILCLHETITRP